MRLVSILSLLAVAMLVLVSRHDAAIQLAGLGMALALGAAASWHILRAAQFATISWSKIFLLAIALRVLALFAVPILEDDYFRYLWDAYRFATTGSPYGAAPAAFFSDASVPLKFQSILNFINYPDVPTIYGPVMQLMFLFGYIWAPGQVAALQIQNVVLDLILIGLLARAGAGRRWLLLYAISPLVLKEAIITAHPDGLVGIFAVAGFIYLRRPYLGGGLLGLAVATKVSALVLLPFLLSRGAWRAVLAVAGVLLACYLPFLLMPGSELTALSSFAQHWRFNPLLFSGIEAIFGLRYARPLAGIFIILLLAWLYWADWRARLQRWSIPSVDRAFGAVLIFAPVVNPWYLLWLLPFAVLRPSRTVWAATFVLPLSYLNGNNFTQFGLPQFDLPIAITLIEISVLAGMAWLDWRRPLLTSSTSHSIR